MLEYIATVYNAHFAGFDLQNQINPK